MAAGLAVAPFAAAVTPLVLTPGTSLTLLVRHDGERGRRAAVPVAAGTVSGLAVHATLAGVGLASLVLRSSELFEVLRIVGGVWLLVLGVLTWRGPRPAVAPTRRRGPAHGGAFVQALLGNVLNPKAAGVFLTVAPQFVDPDRALVPQLWALAAAQAALVCCWLGVWTYVVGRVRRAARGTAEGPRARTAATLRRVSGAVLVALGLRTLAVR
jgi:threonine/homoserine/homoserine lactone efflux protein